MPFLTPDEQNSPRNGAVLLKNVNIDPQILGILSGALSPLYYSFNWEKFGGMTPEQAREYFNEIEVEIVTSLCQAIADCLLDKNSPAFEAVKKLVEQGFEASTEAPVFGSTAGATEINLGGTCDNDKAFGFATQIVDFLNQAITDVFQSVEVMTNASERIGIFVDNVPIISEVLDVGDQIIEELAEGYDGAYNQVLRDTFRCDLYCLMVSSPNCQITFSQMADYFMGLAGTSLSAVTLEQALDTLFGAVPLQGNAIVYASHALFCYVVAYGSNWAGVDMQALQRTVQSYFNDPDNDWAGLCVNCASNQWYKDFNFQNGQQGWIPTVETTGSYPNLAQAQFVQGIFKNVTLSGNAILTMERAFPSANITRTVIHYEMDTGSLGQRRAFYTSGLNIDLNNTAGVWVTDVTRTYTAVTKLKIALHKGSTAGTPFRVTRVEIYGTGAYPF